VTVDEGYTMVIQQFFNWDLRLIIQHVMLCGATLQPSASGDIYPSYATVTE